jgi:hypothetical protein
MLSERLKVFSMQQRNYLMIATRFVARSSLIFVLFCATRRFLNFFISGSIFLFSLVILIFSFILNDHALNIAGMVVTSKSFIAL